MFKPRLDKNRLLIISAVFVFILIWRLYYVLVDNSLCGSNPYSFLSEHCFGDTRTHSYKYLINDADICKPFPDKTFLLIVVLSRTSEFEERQAVRQTWGSLAVSNKEIRLVFMLGYRPEIHSHDLKTENEKYHDIIQEDFYDSYRNLSIKSEAILRFANTFCSGVKYILKVDVDVFLNLPVLIDDLRKREGTNMIMGHVLQLVYLFRTKDSKWYTDSYPLTFHPYYVSGPAYILSGDAAEKLLYVALKTKYYFVEDVFITGIVRQRSNVELIHHRGFGYRNPFVDICWLENKISGHSYTKEQMIELWSQKVKNKSCTWTLRIFYMLYDILAWW
ncbi:beta-1,3-galactosyltransferase 1-like [Patella vulgata]|uniref:beta-1,3-galactosyltransferase 1-like n=1 Tax=Patella vulgata TaxID=6465 RepID=UPI00217FD395|nr:beta-1,3-galactosyltransferase 1-like [Patella vulgata]